MEDSAQLEEEKHDINSSGSVISYNVEKDSNIGNGGTEPSTPDRVAAKKHSEINNKPKYNLKKLKKKLKKKLVKIIQKIYGEVKYEELDNELSIIYSEWWCKNQSDLDFLAIKYFHPYERIKGKSLDNREDEKIREEYGEKFGDKYSDRYYFIKYILEFVSKLARKWKIGNLTNLLYRFSPKYGHTELIDMELLAEDYFTIESLWLSIEADSLPEELGIDEETKTLANFYYESALSVIKILLEISEENLAFENQNEESQSNVDGLCRIKHSFKIPSMISRCFTKAYITPKNKDLKSRIEEMDFACRNFEERIFEILHEYYLSIKIDNDD